MSDLCRALYILHAVNKWEMTNNKVSHFRLTFVK